jgi:hypothetical protein
VREINLARAPWEAEIAALYAALEQDARPKDVV